MARPCSDMGRLQFRDVLISASGVTIHFRQPKETQVKSIQLGFIQDTTICPARTVSMFIEKSRSLRTNLELEHTLFLAYIENPEKMSSIRASTLSSWVKQIMDLSGIDTRVYKVHSIRAASSTKAVEKGHSIQEVKSHANWSLSSNTFEKFYCKPSNQSSSSTAITSSENTITLAD